MTQTTQVNAPIYKSFKISFMGRLIGAIGVTEYITDFRNAYDKESAIKALYNKYEHIEVISVKERALKPVCYVTMNDKFMSGWGCANGKTNKLAIACDTWEQAFLIEKNAKRRNEMKYINISINKPYDNSRTFVSYKHFTDMGGMWVE
jgi:hypothetical protein